MNKAQKKQSLEQGAAVLIFSTLLVKVISALFKIPLSADYCLGSLGFGYFSAAHDLFVPINMLAISGFPVAISRLIADYLAIGNKKGADKVFKISRGFLFLFGVIGAIALCLIVFPFVRLTDKTGQSIYSMLAVAPSILLCSVISCYRGYFEGINNMTPTAVSSILESLGKLILGLSLSYITVKLTGDVAKASAVAILGISSGTLIGLIYMHIKYKHSKAPVGEEGNDEEKNSVILKTIILISLPVVLSSVSGNIVSLIDALTVRWQLNFTVRDDFEALMNMFGKAINDYNSMADKALTSNAIPTFLYGIKAKAFTIYNLIPTLTVLLGVSAVPVLSKAAIIKDKTALKTAAGSVLKLSALISFPAGLGLLALGEPIMSLLYGEGSSSGGLMLSFYGIAAIFAGMFMPLASVLQAINRQNSALRNVIIGLMIKLIANLSLSAVPEINIYGSVFGTLICNFVIFALNLITLIKYTGKITVISDVLKIFVSAVICAAFAFFIGNAEASRLFAVLGIFAAFIVYFSLIVLLKVFSLKEIENLPFGNKLVIFFQKLKFYS